MYFNMVHFKMVHKILQVLVNRKCDFSKTYSCVLNTRGASKSYTGPLIPCNFLWQWSTILTWYCCIVHVSLNIMKKKCITKWRITLSIYNTCPKLDSIIVPYVEEGCFIPLVLIYSFKFNTISVPFIFRKYFFQWNNDHDTPLCDTPLLDNTSPCDTPDELLGNISKCMLQYHEIGNTIQWFFIYLHVAPVVRWSNW